MGERPSIFFLRGHPRSGTNWVGRLLSLHPRIVCTGEWDFSELQEALRLFVERDWHVAHRDPIRSLAVGGFERWCRELILATARDGADWVGERTPKPIEPVPVSGCPVIHVQRDGRDVLVSWTHHQHRRARTGEGGLRGRMREQTAAYASNPRHFIEHPGQLLHDESWVREIARQWAAYARADAAAIDRSARGEGVRVHPIRYESLLAGVERERAGMYRFLGLDPEEALPLAAGVKTGAGFEAERPGEFNRKGAAGDWVNYFTAEQKRWFREEAGPTLIELGYERSENW